MIGQVKLTGMVLTAMPVGEYDKRITILTKERGKITAFAKGARRPKSMLLGCTQPFAFGEFTLFEGKDAYNVAGAEIQNYFAEIRDDLDTIYYGMYFCELAGYLSKENIDSTETLKLLYQTLKALVKTSLNNKLIRRVFELRLMAVFGVMPEVFKCLMCGKAIVADGGSAWFCSENGGIYCEDCIMDMNGKDFITSEDFSKYEMSTGRIRICSSTIYTMQYILTSALNKLYTFSVSEEVLSELEKVMTAYLDKQVGKRMKSEQML